MRDTWCPFSVTISVCPLQISTSIQNYFCDSVFWRHLWCFNRVRGPLVTAPDLLLYVQLYNIYSALILSCFVYNAYNSKEGLGSQPYMHLVNCALCLVLACCVFIVQFLLLNSTCTWSLVLYLLACCVQFLLLNYTCTWSRLWGWITLADTCTPHGAPCTVDRAPCTHRAKPHHRQSRGLSRKIWTAPPTSFHPHCWCWTCFSNINSFRSLLINTETGDRPTFDLNASRASTGKAHIQWQRYQNIKVDFRSIPTKKLIC